MAVPSLSDGDIVGEEEWNAHVDLINQNESNVSTNSSDISTNASDISSLQTDVSSNTSNISTNTSDISTNASDISSLDTRVADLETPVLLTRSLASTQSASSSPHVIQWDGSGRTLGGWSLANSNQEIHLPSAGLYKVFLQIGISSDTTFTVGAYLLKNTTTGGAGDNAELTVERDTYDGGQTIWQVTGALEADAGDYLVARLYLGTAPQDVFATSYGGTKILVEKVMD